MLDLGVAVIGALMATPPYLIGRAIFRAKRATRRNRDELCGDCAGPLYAPNTLAGPSLVEGKLICEPCAEKQRKRLERSLLVIGAWTTAVVAFSVGVAILSPSTIGSHPWLIVGIVPVEYTIIFGAALAQMKRANRKAAEKLGIPLQVRMRNIPNAASTANTALGNHAAHIGDNTPV